MAYTVVPTVVTGEVWTATNHNTYVRANFLATVPDIFTAKGDLAVASGADAAGILNVGADGQVLKASSSDTLGVVWDVSPIVDLLTAKGDLLSSSSDGQLGVISAGTDFDLFLASTTDTLGVAWGGKHYSRYGASDAANWNGGGGSPNYNESSMIQTGVASVPHWSSSVIITYSPAFAAGSIPFIMLGAPSIPGTTGVGVAVRVSTDTGNRNERLKLALQFVDASSDVGSLDVPWMAIGKP